MPSICLYFQVHQPYRLKKYSIFDAQHDQHYFDEEKNKAIMHKVAEKCYLPANKIILELIRKNHGKFRVAFGISGTALEQFAKYSPEVLASFRALALTGCVEFLAETYCHSLSGLFSKLEFVEQINKHRDLLLSNFDYEPKTFRNTELIYNNEIGRTVAELGYKGILTEGAAQVLGWRSPNYVYKAVGSDLKLLMRNYKLSDDIAYRFSDKNWSEYPINAPRYARWISDVKDHGEVVNLFMDYETFGEHHWKETGILSFLQELPKEILKDPNNEFLLPTEVFEKYQAKGEIEVPLAISWADSQKDTSAWLGNNMQNDAAIALYKLEGEIKAGKNKQLLDDWRRLTSADHLYYISTKHLSDGDVHRYFSPYKSPYDAFINFMNVLENLRKRLHGQGKPSKKEEKVVKTKPVKKTVAKKKTAVKKPAKKAVKKSVKKKK